MLSPGLFFKALGADPLEPFDLSIDIGRLDIEVHAVLGDFGFADPLEQKIGQCARLRCQQDIVARGSKPLDTERLLPERGDGLSVDAVEHESDLRFAHPGSMPDVTRSAYLDLDNASCAAHAGRVALLACAGRKSQGRRLSARCGWPSEAARCGRVRRSGLCCCVAREARRHCA